MNQGTNQQQIDERLFSRAAEVAVIGSMVIDPECIDKVSVIVGPDSFAFPENRIIYQMILDLREGGKPIDGLTLRNTLQENNQLEKIGGLEYLKKILDNVPTAANAEYYANIVLAAAQRRRLARAVEDMGKVLESDRPVGESIAEIKQMAAGLDGAVELYNSMPVIRNLDCVEVKPITWLWYNKIPCGMFTLVFGNPGLGKSFEVLDWAARISVGGNWPDNEKAPLGTVVLLTAEDPLEQVVKPRLMSLGADPKNIFALEAVRVMDEDGRQRQEFFSLQDDLSALRQTIRPDTKLIIIDPISAYYGRGFDSHRDSDIRGVLSPLVDLAEQTGVAIVGVTHLNKNATGKAVYRALGSIGLIAAARAAWLVCEDPDNPESKRRLLIPAKQNILINPTGLAFEIADGKIIYENEPVNTTADEALGTGSTVVSIEKDKAVAWLCEVLTPGKAMASTALLAQAKEQGIKESTLRRAKREAGVISYELQESGKNQWFWRIDK
jgi:putative DNA primase/helicase